MGLKKEQLKDMQTLDFCLDDICRMDFVAHFVNLKVLVLINQGIQVMEVSYILFLNHISTKKSFLINSNYYNK